MEKNKTFGFKKVDSDTKKKLINNVFSSVANKYDIMNDLMSFGTHHLWKRFAIEISSIRTGSKVLDVATGTGDILNKIKNINCFSVGIDQNFDILNLAKNKLINNCITPNLVNGMSERLPFKSDIFDLIITSFGFRNFTDKIVALEEFKRILKLSGKIIILEFSEPSPFINYIYKFYRSKLIPILGERVTGDKVSYQYLSESIEVFENQEELKSLIKKSGFTNVSYNNLMGGLVAIHKGFKC
jgi:demethylmenaquinone methyltransferase/2-methoxy-6-polyprenyl-1,4-benzoquinol methylase